MTRVILVAAILAAGTACTMGPKYQRPVTPAPVQFRGAVAPEVGNASLGDARWWDVFQDEALRELIRKAIDGNLDLRVAAARVEQARAAARMTRADQFPAINGTAGVSRVRNPSNPVFPAFEANTSQLGPSAVWQLDFWGRYRKATEAARAELAATEWGRKAILATLVSDVAAAYFTLCGLDLELEVSRRTVAARKESLELTRTLERGGAVSLMDVHQAEILVEQAGRDIPALERRIEQQENLLSTLLGQNPGPVGRGLRLTDQPAAPEVPVGLPSELLERRPDIQQAEQRLIAANARIGVAKAAWFPQISLTGTAGFQAFSIEGLFDSKVYNVAASLTTPIFDAGRIRSNIRLTEAQKEELIASYRQAVQQSFREVSDALVATRKIREYRERQQALEAAARQAAELSKVRYKGGVVSYLEVLQSETTLYNAEMGLAQAALDERLALVQVYTALGGGWQQ